MRLVGSARGSAKKLRKFLEKKKTGKKCNIVTKCGFEPVYSSVTVENVTSEPPSAAATNIQITEL